MVRLLLFALALVFVPGLALEGEEAFDDLIPDMQQDLFRPPLTADLQWGEDEEVQIIPKEELEAQQTGQIEVEDGQLPDMNVIIPPGINTDLTWDDDNHIDMVSKDELEERDRNRFGTDAPEAIEEEETGTGAPEPVEEEETGTGAPEEVQEEEETGTDAPVEAEEEETGTGAPVEVEEEETGTGAPDVVEEEEETGTGAPEVVEEEEEIGEEIQLEPVHPMTNCFECLEHLQSLVESLGDKAAQLPF